MRKQTSDADTPVDSSVCISCSSSVRLWTCDVQNADVRRRYTVYHQLVSSLWCSCELKPTHPYKLTKGFRTTTGRATYPTGVHLLKNMVRISFNTLYCINIKTSIYESPSILSDLSKQMGNAVDWVKSPLYSALNNTDCVKATFQYQI